MHLSRCMSDTPSRGADFDIIIVGAGPAGLTAALYAARYCRRTLVLHDGQSRAAEIPLTHNVPAFPSGITGPDLLERMRQHAAHYGACFAMAEVISAEVRGDGFRLTARDGRCWSAAALIVATGVQLHKIPLDQPTHDAAVSAGVLRYCPICDGFEHRGTRIGVVGCSASGAAEALFLKSFASDITLLPRCDVELTVPERAQLAAAGIRIVEEPVTAYHPSASDIVVELSGRDDRLTFDVIYPALGSTPRNELLDALGLKLDPEGMAPAQAEMKTDIPGLYCAGDIVAGLDQISVAVGHGALAATRAHNWLRAKACADDDPIQPDI